jgi:enoyl-CoA hydratase/carnithine racemase
MSEPTVLTERVGATLVITLNRPRAGNSADAASSYAVDAAFNEAEADDGIGAMILTAAGDRVFCSGMDLKEAAEKGVGLGLVPGRGFLGMTERRFKKPVIAAVNGAAVAGGLEISLACDAIVAADHAYFSVPEVKRGLFPWAGGVQRLARQIPRAAALEIILTGDPVSAQRLYDLGVVNRVVPKEKLRESALALAEAMLVNSWPAIRYARQLYEESLDMPLPQALLRGHELGREMQALGDSREGVKAYAEKRQAKFEHDKQEPTP